MQDLKPLELGKIILQSAGDYDVKTMRKIVELPNILPESTNYRNNGGNTGLLMAAHINKEKEVVNMFSYLLQLNGLEINAVNKQGTTALMISAKKSHNEAVSWLLANGADFEIVDESKKSAIDYAVNPAVRSTIMAAIDAKIAALRLEVVIEKSKELNSMMSSLIADPSSNIFGLTKLVTTVPYPEALDYKNESGSAPLEVAVANYRLDIVELLIDGGADPVCIDKTGRTLLMRLCSTKRLPSYPNSAISRKKESDRVSMVRVVAASRRYQQLSICDKEGMSTLHVAALSGYDEDCKIIITACQLYKDFRGDFSVSTIEASVDGGTSDDDSSVTSISSAGSSVRSGSKTKTASTSRKRDGDKRRSRPKEGKPRPRKPVSCPLDKVVDFRQQSPYTYRGTARQRSRRGDTAMVLAARRSFIGVIKVLIENGGADPNLSGVDGMSPLMWAAWTGHEEIVRLLLLSGAKPNLQDEGGKSALFWAIERGHGQLATALLHFGHEEDAAAVSCWPHLANAVPRMEAVEFAEQAASPTTFDSSPIELSTLTTASQVSVPALDSQSKEVQIGDAQALAPKGVAMKRGTSLGGVGKSSGKGSPSSQKSPAKTGFARSKSIGSSGGESGDDGDSVDSKPKSSSSKSSSLKSPSKSGKQSTGKMVSSKAKEALAAVVELDVDEDEIESKRAVEAAAALELELALAAAEEERKRIAALPPPIPESWCNPNLLLTNLSSPVLTLCRLTMDHGPFSESEAVALLHLLVKRGASVNIRNTDGCTALMWATMNGKHDLVKTLIDCKADPTIKDLNNLEALNMTKHKDFGTKLLLLEAKEAWQRAQDEVEEEVEEEIIATFS